MIRKIGFGNTERRRGLKTVVQPASEVDGKVGAHATAQDRPRSASKPRSWMIIVILLVWLVVWTAALLIVAGLMISGGGEGFLVLLIWEVFGGIAWLLAVRALIRLLRGEPLQKGKTA